MSELLNPDYAPLLVFVLRVLNNAVGTVRIIMMTNQRRVWGFSLASLESLLFAYTAGLVLTDLQDVPKLAAYVFGFAVGGYVGMWIERRFLHTYDTVSIVAGEDKASEIAAALRDEGYGVTVTSGTGRMGAVCMLRIVAEHNEIKHILNITHTIKPDAFVTVDQVQMIKSGWLRSQQQRQA